jgi:hypothetical protein
MRIGLSNFVRTIACVAFGLFAIAVLTEPSRASLTKRTKPAKQTQTEAPAQSQTGSVSIKFVKAGLIVGVGSGSGTLKFRGKTHQLTVGGVDVGNIGITSVQLAGTATNLQNIADIAGTYNAAGSGATIGASSRFTTVRNEKGVVLKLRGLQSGLHGTLGLSGMTISVQ